MKINKIYVKVTLFVVLMFQMHNVAAAERIYPVLDNGMVMDTLDMQREGVEAARIIAQNKIETAKKEIESLRQRTLRGKITPVAQGIKEIKDQIAIIVDTEYSLNNIIERAVAIVESAESNEQGYFTKFVEGARYLGSQIIAPFRSGYGYTQEEKEIALRVIEKLVEQQKEFTKDYETEINKKNSFHRRHAIKNNYQEIIELLDNEIYQQQLITGNAMSIKRKLFWAAVAAGAVVAGANLLSPLEEVTDSKNQLSLLPAEVENSTAFNEEAPKGVEILPAVEISNDQNFSMTNDSESTSSGVANQDNSLSSEDSSTAEELAPESTSNKDTTVLVEGEAPAEDQFNEEALETAEKLPAEISNDQNDQPETR